MTPKGFVIAGPSSGAGKTTVTLGLMAAFKKRGLTVQPRWDAALEDTPGSRVERVPYARAERRELCRLWPSSCMTCR